MPSLRARTERPSYALLAEGLEGLSDDDRDSDASQAEGSETAKRRANTADADHDMQSGGSDDAHSKGAGLYPKQRGKGKDRATNKPKAKPKRWAVEDNDSGSEYEKASEEEEDDDLEDEAIVPEDVANELKEPEAEDDDDMSGSDIVPVTLSTPNPKPSAPRAPFTGAPSHSKQAAYVQTESNLIPPQYREMIKKHAEIVAAPIRGKPINAEEKPREVKTRALDPDLLPYGPSTPFVTRLKQEIKGRERAEIIYDDQLLLRPGREDDKTARQAHATQAVKAVTVISPWQIWQGEGWWPEMSVRGGIAPATDEAAPAPTKHKGKGKASSATGQANGTGLPPGWRLRESVRLGLESVGRIQVNQMNIIPESTAQAYLPKTLAGEKPVVRFNIGPFRQQRKLDFTIFDSHVLSEFNPVKQGFVFSAGGPVWGLDWCPVPVDLAQKYNGVQYLAVSTLPSLDTYPAIGEKWAADSRGCVQIWAASPPIVDDEGVTTDQGSAKCELVLCVDGGPVHDLKWMPMGAWDDDQTAGLPKLGIIAACQLDGSVSLYAVPHPRELRKQLGTREGEPVYWQTGKPLLRLEVADAMCYCLDWINGGRVICGMSNGFVASWDVLAALRNRTDEAPLPAMYFSAAQSMIRTIAVSRAQPHDSDENVDYGRDPVYVVVGSHDATASIIDLRDLNQPFEIVQTRMPIQAVGWSSQNGQVLMADQEHTVQMFHPSGRLLSKTYNFSHHRGPVWAISSSDYHTMTLTSSADGSVLVSNLQTGWFRRRGGGMIYQRLFEIDYDKHLGEYRILDDFQVEEMPLDGAAQKNTNRAKGLAHSLEGNPTVAKSGDWPLEVGVHKTCWNNNAGLGRANWIASGTTSGLCRIDIVKGRFLGGRVPQGMGPP